MENKPKPATPDASASGRREPRYKAFVSYSHTDRRWARWLLRHIESYRVPRRLIGQDGRFGPVVRRLAPLFRDREELASASDLGDGIRSALEDSAALILIASPASASSRWVNEEVLEFKRLGRGNRVFAFIVDGDPGATDGDQACFPPALRFRLGVDGELTDEVLEPIAADARPVGDGRKRAVRKLIAGLLGVPYDALRRREAQRRNRRLAVVTAASLIGMAITVGLAISAYMAREDAERRRTQAEDLLGFMVGDLRESLEPLGRLDLLDKVGDKATEYFSSAEGGDVSDEGLIRQAQALTQIGEVRLSQGRFDEALMNFEQAYERSVELLKRRPNDGDRLFSRGQAEFWVGFVAWKREDIELARAWFTSYLETSRQLTAQDPANEDWAIELAYARHNLAVLELEFGDLDAAARTFEQQVKFLASIDCDAPRCDAVEEDLADAITWQGLTALARGRLEDAYRFFLASRAAYSELMGRRPGDRSLEFEYADETGNAGLAAWWLGRSDEAHALFERAWKLHLALVQHDPENLRWREYCAGAALALARSWQDRGDYNTAASLIDSARSNLDPLMASDSASLLILEKQARLHRLQARALAANNDFEGALVQARLALEQLSSQFVPDRSGDPHEGEVAASLVLLGQIHQARGNQAAARQSWQAAVDLVAGRFERSLHPAIGLPYVESWHLLRGDDSLTLQRLRATGLATPGLWPED